MTVRYRVVVAGGRTMCQGTLVNVMSEARALVLRGYTAYVKGADTQGTALTTVTVRLIDGEFDIASPAADEPDWVVTARNLLTNFGHDERNTASG